MHVCSLFLGNDEYSRVENKKRETNASDHKNRDFDVAEFDILSWAKHSR